MAVYPNGLTTPPTVTDVFGYRIHPIYGDRRLHTGTDSVNHPRGRNYAPEGGIVTFAGYNGGAGNQVSWDVPGTNRQWRAKHHAAFEVGRGDQISMAQSLGITGTTGDSTGVHCHLELLIAGEYVDPFAWIALNLIAQAAQGGTPLTETESEHPMFWLRKNSNGEVHLFGHPTEGHKHVTSGDELGLLNTLLSGVDSLSTIPVPPRGGAGVFGVNDDLWQLAIEWFGQPVR